MDSSLLLVEQPNAPTAALPGSEEKICVLAQRARRGLPLWHPLDARFAQADQRATNAVAQVWVEADGGEPRAVPCLVS